MHNISEHEAAALLQQLEAEPVVEVADSFERCTDEQAARLQEPEDASLRALWHQLRDLPDAGKGPAESTKPLYSALKLIDPGRFTSGQRCSEFWCGRPKDGKPGFVEMNPGFDASGVGRVSGRVVADFGTIWRLALLMRKPDSGGVAKNEPGAASFAAAAQQEDHGGDRRDKVPAKKKREAAVPPSPTLPSKKQRQQDDPVDKFIAFIDLAKRNPREFEAFHSICLRTNKSA